MINDFIEYWAASRLLLKGDNPYSPAERSQRNERSAGTFAPTYFVLLLGQIGPLVLLGVIGFLIAAKTKAWEFAGLSLSLAAIKPHLLYLFWLALFLWIVKERKWRLLLVFLTAGMSVAGLPLLFDRQIYSQYFQLLGDSGVVRPLEWATPALGTALAQFFAIPGMWLRWLPSLAGAAWLFWHWSYWQREWNWISQWPFILVVSTATAGFAWTFDHIVLLPAVIQAAVWTNRCDNKHKRAAIIAVHVTLAAILLVMKIFVRNDFWYFWAAPAYLLLYVYARASMSTLAQPNDEPVRA